MNHPYISDYYWCDITKNRASFPQRLVPPGAYLRPNLNRCSRIGLPSTSYTKYIRGLQNNSSVPLEPPFRPLQSSQVFRSEAPWCGGLWTWRSPCWTRRGSSQESSDRTGGQSLVEVVRATVPQDQNFKGAYPDPRGCSPPWARRFQWRSCPMAASLPTPSWG